ncbi:hypothetical protein nvc1_020 [Namao virus]|nr:hypothetical protein nvc1_020 [Namao virus]
MKHTVHCSLISDLDKKIRLQDYMSSRNMESVYDIEHNQLFQSEKKTYKGNLYPLSQRSLFLTAEDDFRGTSTSLTDRASNCISLKPISPECVNSKYFVPAILERNLFSDELFLSPNMFHYKDHCTCYINNDKTKEVVNYTR